MKHSNRKKGGIWKNNGLSIVFIGLFFFTWIAQAFTGFRQFNEEMQEQGGATVGFVQYLGSGHFIEATFENWESEFLQMALFVVLTACLYQRGSSESNDPDKKEAQEPVTKDSPWPVRRGGLVRKIYENSLSIALFVLFAFSFLLHWLGSWEHYNKLQGLEGKPQDAFFAYLGNSKFWFESFQNWQSEFLSVFAMVALSIFLRQKGSAQSKPVEAPDSKTGD
ncbi:DUF6766 family protein [Flaviaesturariibacter aridisoli]|uniref:Transmembrane protein n=1 Tax=Flaviaesturariibacter aridisoli TaxID=2545761 RepID=A0A4R4E276_9BACT|nr:DUF6766 family protein [Flaviaesturariibacter aridisoli]TCZ72967.1 hypothetical protein E0486_07845 [Flaviaesturariibacter aridisoli]